MQFKKQASFCFSVLILLAILLYSAIASAIRIPFSTLLSGWEVPNHGPNAVVYEINLTPINRIRLTVRRVINGGVNEPLQSPPLGVESMNITLHPGDSVQFVVEPGDAQGYERVELNAYIIPESSQASGPSRNIPATEPSSGEERTSSAIIGSHAETDIEGDVHPIAEVVPNKNTPTQGPLTQVSKSQKNPAPSIVGAVPPKGNGMYSKLVFIVGGQRIEFSAYELITIAQQIVRERQEDLDRNEIVLPDHDAIDESLEENFWDFTQQLTNSLERSYQLTRKEILGFIKYTYNICKNAPLFIHTIVTDPENKVLLDYIKTKEKTRCFEIQLTRRIIIPLPLMQMNTIRQWIFIAKYLADNYQRMELAGWWFRIGGRVIRLRNDVCGGKLPRSNKQFYAADHGFEEAIVRNTGRHIERTIRSFTWNDNGGTFFRAFRFWRFYTLAGHTNLKPEVIAQHQNSIREEFIYHLSRNNGIVGSSDLCQLLLLSLASSDPSLRGTFEASIWQPRHSWELGNRGIIGRPEASPAEPLSEVVRRQYDAIFDDLIEQFRYVTQAIIQQRVSFMRDALNPFHTQIRQIMHEEVSDNYIMAHVLCELAKAVNHGRQEPLFRELSAYGDRDPGDTYPKFERSIAEYFVDPKHLSPAALAVEMRSILAGNSVGSENLGFLPCLTAAWFISETARNPLTTLTSMILLDMLENEIIFSTPGVDNWYLWRNILIHPQTDTH